MELPAINGLSASVEAFNSWWAGWTLNFGSSFFDGSTWNGPLVSFAAAKGWA